MRASFRAVLDEPRSRRGPGRRRGRARRVMVESALVREESRGSHYRSDHPDQDDARWLRFIVRREPDGEVEKRPVEFSRKRTDPSHLPAEDLERGEPGRRV